MFEIEVDVSELESYTKFLDKASDGDMVLGAFKSFVSDYRDHLIANSPIGDIKVHPDAGRLKNSWTQPSYTKAGNTYTATIHNTAEYSGWVNDGHYQEPGRYVPAIHAQLVHYYVPGLYFVERTADEMALRSNSIIKSELLKEWKKLRTQYYDRKGEELAGLI